MLLSEYSKRNLHRLWENTEMICLGYGCHILNLCDLYSDVTYQFEPQAALLQNQLLTQCNAV